MGLLSTTQRKKTLIAHRRKSRLLTAGKDLAVVEGRSASANRQGYPSQNPRTSSYHIRLPLLPVDLGRTGTMLMANGYSVVVC
jgi:hypothetical protein